MKVLIRHQCIIDLERSVLVIKSANIETKFLTENELPLSSRPHYEENFETHETKPRMNFYKY